MANVDSPSGFLYEGRFSDQSPPIHDYELAESTTVSLGDPVTLTGGYLAPAASGAAVLGVVLGAAATDDNVYNNSGEVIVAGAGEHPLVKIVLALPDVYFRVQDANATAPTIALRGVSCDFTGTTGVVEVNSSVTLNGDVQLIDKAGPDNINGNEYGANMDWLGIFANRFIA